MTRILITGGAGFIGSHLADALLERGDDVTLLDSLHPQIHGPESKPPAYLAANARLVVGDVRSESVLAPLVAEADVVVHLAAHTGVGQSMYQAREYLEVNTVGTAALLEQIVRHRHDTRVVVASSRAVYGEGAYRCRSCGPVSPDGREPASLALGEFELPCPNCSDALLPAPTHEGEPTRPQSVYALSKLDQERLALLFGKVYPVPIVALRYFNVYGPRQSLRNPYTGVVAAFATRALNGRPPEVYEDGRESRDFVHVADVVRATVAAIDSPDAPGAVFNVGHGTALTLYEVASLVATALAGPEPVVTGHYRLGDIRHSLADISFAGQVLGFAPKIGPNAGIAALARGLAGQPSEDLSDVAAEELAAHGLLATRHR
jgi:dTDP-L-rhamnose 4-epimerase